ncbi:MAG: MotA/TolQ/ExbB proton channel family protein [Acidobacteria bacterium]|nr:MotA/TolQ/ExbB proton channel family protein [Acidobacteriota bacterium]
MTVSTGFLAPAATDGFSGTFLDLVFGSGPMVLFVLGVLFFFSVATWAILANRLRTFRRCEEASAGFLHAFAEADDPAGLLRGEEDPWGESPMAAAFRSALGPGPADRPGARSRALRLAQVERLAAQAGARELRRLGRYLNFLATTGSVTPFIGLFGTVWGIMKAFQGIGLTGSASLAAVAPGISEALVATAAGLAAAIPAVIGYNHFLNRLQTLHGEFDQFSANLINLAEERLAALETADRFSAGGGIG